jgi:DNA polymerase-1
VNALEGDGPIPCDLLFVGEAPGEMEEEQGKVFIGRAGQRLNEILGRVSLDRSKVRVENAVGCRPPNNRVPTTKEIDACRPRLWKLIEEVKPKVIVAMGSVAFKCVMESPGTLLTKMRGTVLERNGIKVVPTIHPASALRKIGEDVVIQKDFELALKVLKQQQLRTEGEVRIIRTLQHLEKLKKYLLQSPGFALDLETVSFDWYADEILCASFCADPKVAFVVPILGQGLQKIWADGEYSFVWALLKEIFESSVPKFAQNYKFDCKFLAKRGIRVHNITFDTLLGHHLIDENVQHNLEFLVSYYLGEQRHDTELRSILTTRKMTFDQAPNKVLWKYGGSDAIATIRVKEREEELLKEAGLLDFLRDFYLPLEDALLQMELNGVKVDLQGLKKASLVYAQRTDELQQELNRMVGKDFNLASVKQLREVLYSDLKLKAPLSTPKGGTSTSEAALIVLAETSKAAKKVLEWRHLMKLKGTFLDGKDGKGGLLKFVKDTGRIYPEYSAVGTVTGRLSCRNPNLQNIPTDPIIRNLFVAEEGNVFISADYRQMEARVAAALAGDMKLVEELDAVDDAFVYLASALFKVSKDQVTSELRSRVKGIFYGVLYGRGATSVAKDLGATYEEAEQWIREFFNTFYLLNVWRNRMVLQAQSKGFVVNAFGRRRHLNFNSTDKKDIAESFRQAINSPVQSTASDCLSLATVRLHRATKESFPELKMLMTLHDALFFEVPSSLKKDAVSLVKGVMETPIEVLHGLKISVKIKVGACWEDPNCEVY